MARDIRKRLPSVAIILLVLLVLAALGGAFIYAGVYDVGADAPHSPIVTTSLQELRERSIANYGRRVSVPADFEEPKRVAAGAGLYGEMCTGCHLGPGLNDQSSVRACIQRRRNLRAATI